MTDIDLTAQIASEVYTAMERLGADPDLLAIIGSWRDTGRSSQQEKGPALDGTGPSAKHL